MCARKRDHTYSGVNPLPSSLIYVYIYIDMCTHIYIWTYLYMCIFTYIFICIYVYIYTYIYICIYMYIHICIYIYICTHTCVHLYIHNKCLLICRWVYLHLKNTHIHTLSGFAFFSLSLDYSVHVRVEILDKYVDVIDRLRNASITTYELSYVLILA